MGTSVSQHVNFTSNEYLIRFAGAEYISPNDPFWNRFLSFTLKAPTTSADDQNLEEKIKPICTALLKNNLKTGNLASLLHVVLSRSSELLISTQMENNMFSWQTYNALFVIRCYTKFLVQTVKEADLIKHFETQGTENDRRDNDESILARFIESLVDLLVRVPLVDFTYNLHCEAVNCLIVLLSVQLFTTQSADQLQIYRIIMENKQAEAFTRTLLQCFIEQPKPPASPGGSLLIGFASELWSLLTLNSGSQESESSPLANQSLLLLLILINHCTTSKNVFRDALSSHDENQRELLTTICQTLHKEETTLFLYHLIHRNSHFRNFVLAQSDLENLVVPILKSVYNGSDSSCHHMYMSLIILLILTEYSLFNETVHATILKTVPWYTERVIHDISLGGLIILVTTRTVQYNLLKMRDKYLHTNCLAALANMSSEFTDLDPYVCQRLISLFEVLAKTHARANSELSAVEEALRIILEVINSCLYNRMKQNTHLVYTLLYKKQVFEPFKTHPAFQDIVHNITTVIEYFTSKLEKADDHSADVQTVLARVEEAALRWSKTTMLKKFPELKFKYVEEEKPEEFFIPYVWSLVAQLSGMYWNAALFKQC